MTTDLIHYWTLLRERGLGPVTSFQSLIAQTWEHFKGKTLYFYYHEQIIFINHIYIHIVIDSNVVLGSFIYCKVLPSKDPMEVIILICRTEEHKL